MNVGWLQTLPEAKLREDVLVPLFKAMGFRDVVHWHGGSMEQGKDIVMWKSGDLSERVNYAVVVVAERVSGQATGAGSAAKVATQIQQAFGSRFRDAISGTEQMVNKVWVVSSHEIRKEAQESIQHVITPGQLHRVTSYVSGDKLCELIVLYLPAAGAFLQLQTALDQLQGSDSNYGLGVLVSKGKKKFWLEPKKGPDGALPPPVTFLIKYDESEEAKKIQADIEDHLKAGSPIVIPGKYVSSVHVPESMRPFFQNISSLAIAPRMPKGKLLVRIELNQPDEGKYIVENIELTQTTGNPHEITLNNDESIIPWKFELVLSPKESLAHFSVQLRLEGLTASKQLEGWQLTRALARAKTIRIVDSMTGLTILSRTLQEGDPHPEEGDPLLIETLKMLAVLEQALTLPFKLPEIAEEDLLRQIEYAFHAVTEGKVALNTGPAEFKSEKGFAEVALKAFQQNEPITIAVAGREPAKISLLGHEIDLGCPIIEHKNIILDQGSATMLESAMRTGEEEHGPFLLKVLPFDGTSDNIVYYPKWMKKSELPTNLAELLRRL